MPRVLTMAAQITCPHGGMGNTSPLPNPARPSVNGFDVLLDGDQGTLTCAAFTPPCAGYSLKSMKLNALSANDVQVMLVTDFVQSDTGFPLTLTETHMVYDDTSPAALPAAGPAPQLPPELTTEQKPQALAVPPTMPFSLSAFSTTGNPAVLSFTYTFQDQYPGRWMLWQVGPGVNRELTNGAPPLVVVPAGGAWAAPAGTVSLTIPGPSAAALTPGLHSFVLTAVNKRGLFGMAEAQVTVSP
jgi:hypothetical protein